MIFLLLLVNNLFINGQSFSIYSVYRYGYALSKEQSKKINIAEWHKQEAKKINEEIVRLERQIKVEKQKEEEEKVKKLESKKEKLLEKKYENLKNANELFLIVYKEKIEILWEKYESDDEALVIIKAMENKGLKLFEQAKEERNSLQKGESIENRNKIDEKACINEEKGLDMFSSALEGYYNYELHLKRMKEEENTEVNSNTAKRKSNGKSGITAKKNDNASSLVSGPENITVNQIGFDNKNIENGFSSEKNNMTTDDSEVLIITRDAPIIYMENDEIFNLIMNNYNIDNINEEIVITLGELRKIDNNRKELKNTDQPVHGNNKKEISDSVITDYVTLELDNSDVMELSQVENNDQDESNAFNDINELKENESTTEEHKKISLNESNYDIVNEVNIPSLIKESSNNNKISKTDISHKKEKIQDNEVHVSNEFIITDKIYPSDEIIFKVQIAAARKPMTEKDLKYRYKGTRQIEMYQEEGWNKYAIGGFKSYSEANEIIKNSGVRDAFIAAYKNNDKMVLYKAIRDSKVKEYRIQIAASRNKMTEERLKKFYNGEREIKETYEDKWYKYTIEGGSNLEKTKEFIEKNGIKRAYIVTYINNKRID